MLFERVFVCLKYGPCGSDSILSDHKLGQYEFKNKPGIIAFPEMVQGEKIILMNNVAVMISVELLIQHL